MTSYSAYLRGVNFRPEAARIVAKTLEEGHTLALQREPSNPHDTNAIQVIEPHSGQFIGYVAKEIAGGGLADDLDSGRMFDCTVESNINGNITLSIEEVEGDELVDETDAP